MKPYVLYDSLGNILEVGFTSEEHLGELRAGGFNVLVGQGTTTAHYVDVTTQTICGKRATRLMQQGTVRVGDEIKVKMLHPLVDPQVTISGPAGSPFSLELAGEVAEFTIPTASAGFYAIQVSHPSIFTNKLGVEVLPAAKPQ